MRLQRNGKVWALVGGTLSAYPWESGEAAEEMPCDPEAVRYLVSAGYSVESVPTDDALLARLQHDGYVAYWDGRYSATEKAEAWMRGGV